MKKITISSISLGLLIAAGCSNNFEWKNPLDPANSTINVPNNISPTNNAFVISELVALNWKGGDPNIGDTVTYKVYFDTTQPPKVNVYTGYDTSYSVTDLILNTSYYWMVVAIDNHGVMANGDIWLFTTNGNSPPEIPSNPLPAPGDTVIGRYGYVTWSCQDPNLGDIVTCTIYCDTINPPSSQYSRALYPGTTGASLFFGWQTNYWYIIARDNHGAESVGPVWYNYWRYLK